MQSKLTKKIRPHKILTKTEFITHTNGPEARIVAVVVVPVRVRTVEVPVVRVVGAILTA